MAEGSLGAEGSFIAEGSLVAEGSTISLQEIRCDPLEGRWFSGEGLGSSRPMDDHVRESSLGVLRGHVLEFADGDQGAM